MCERRVSAIVQSATVRRMSREARVWIRGCAVAVAVSVLAVGAARAEGGKGAAVGQSEADELVYAGFSVSAPVYRPSREAAADLFVRPSNGAPGRLTRTLTWEDAPAYSPDARRIAFSRGDMHCHAGECNEPVTANIWVMPASGGAARPLSDPLEDEYPLDSAPMWSPDGRRVAFLRSYAGGGRVGIYVVRADGGSKPRWLVAGWVLAADWSLDGSRIVYIREDLEHAAVDLRVVDLRTGRGATVVAKALAGELTDVAWSPDGRSLAIATDAGVFIVPARGGKARRILHGAFAQVAWAPDGQRLALGRTPPPSWRRSAEKARITVVNSDGSGMRTMAHGRGSAFSPDWHP